LLTAFIPNPTDSLYIAGAPHGIRELRFIKDTT